MKKKFQILQFLFLGIIISIFVSCGKEDANGCTDPDALNYNSDATKDDGTCEYARDKFLGAFSGTSECSPNGFWDSNDFQFTINKGNDHNKILVSFPFQENPGTLIIWEATVDNNSLLFDDEVNAPTGSFFCDVHNSTATLKLLGKATLSGKQFNFPNFRYSVEDIRGMEACFVTCEIEAVKN